MPIPYDDLKSLSSWPVRIYPTGAKIGCTWVTEREVEDLLLKIRREKRPPIEPQPARRHGRRSTDL